MDFTVFHKFIKGRPPGDLSKKNISYNEFVTRKDNPGTKPDINKTGGQHHEERFNRNRIYP